MPGTPTADGHAKKRLAVIGAGPGGYPAAFHGALRGLDVTMIDTEENPGGVCAYRGCIPSKALLHAARVIEEARGAEAFGLTLVPVDAGGAVARARVPIAARPGEPAFVRFYALDAGANAVLAASNTVVVTRE